LSENALKLAYGNVEFQNFPAEDPGPPLQGEGKVETEEWKREEEWGGKGKEWGSRKGRGGTEELKLKEREGKRRKRRREGQRNLDPLDVPDRSRH
jgi:hypothetical protein